MTKPAIHTPGKLHMIGNAHIDPVWLWRWPEGYAEVKATFRSALDRLSESEDFLFTASSAAHYEWVERSDRAMFEEIKARVREGRWEIVGGWWVQPDCNLPGAESFVRQGLLGQRYFESRFGVTASVGYNVDSFGHHAMLPQILAKSGLTRYVFMRPGPHEKGLPGRLFWWESDDGSRVLTFRIPYEYCTSGKDLEPHVRKCAGELKAPYGELMCFYGVGNHGGGPTKENLESIRRMQADPKFPTLEFSTPNRFFAALPDQPYPVVHDELQHHASGTYAAHSGIKRYNRRAENALLAAERWAVIAERVTGQPYPAAELERAWKNVLFNQFHDILAGTSLESAYEDARDELGESLAIAGRALNDAVQALSWRTNIEFQEGTKPIVAFNPHAWDTSANVELEFGGLKETDVLVDDTGQPVPHQTVRSEATVSGWRRKLSFMADLPALGYRVYRVLSGPAGAEAPPIPAGDTWIENDKLRLEVDPETGCISRLFDKAAGVEVLSGPAARPVVYRDTSDTWSHGVLRYTEVAGEFKPSRVRLVEHGPVKSTIRVESEYGRSSLAQDFTLHRDSGGVEVLVTVNWHEGFSVLKLLFPIAPRFPRATFEVPFGHMERPADGEEEPGQAWLDLTGVLREGGLYGLSLLNDAKYSFSVRDREIALTVLRSPIYAHHDPYVPQPDGRYVFMDQGIQRFRYVLLPHEGGWEGAGTVRRAAELNMPPVAVLETFHEGKLPQAQSYLAASPENVVVTAVKRAEDNDDLVVRCVETARVATQTTLRLPGFNRTIEASFGPCEIKTFRVPRDEAAPVLETDLLERPLR